MEYNRGNSFQFDFEPNEIPFGSKSKVIEIRQFLNDFFA